MIPKIKKVRYEKCIKTKEGKEELTHKGHCYCFFLGYVMICQIPFTLKLKYVGGDKNGKE